MKQIFPTSNTTNNTANPNCKTITEQQYCDLVNRVNDAECASSNAVSCVDRLMRNQQNQVCTNQLTATSGSISSLNSANITADSANISSITSDTVKANTVDMKNGSAEYLVSDSATIGCIQSNNIETDQVIADNTTSSQITADEITTGDLNISGTFAVDDLDINNLKAKRIRSETETTDTLNAETANVVNLYAPDAEIQNLTAYKTESNIIDTNYIIHERDPQEVNELGDIYLLFPQFTNGFYLVEADNDTNNRLWSFELTNSIKNIQFRWSEKELGQIVDLKFQTDAAGISIVQVHIHTTEHISLYRNSITTSNVLPIEIYTTDQLPDMDPPMLSVTNLSGTYIQDVIFTNKLHVDCLEMDALFMDCVGVYRELWLTCGFEQSGDLTRPLITCGEEGQYVINRAHCNIVHPAWESPAETVALNSDGIMASGVSCTALLASCTVAKYDGTVKNGWTDCCCWVYPIDNLGNGTVVHGNATVNCNLIVCCGLNAPHIIDSVDKTELNNTLTNMTTGNAFIETWTPPEEWTDDTFSRPSIHCGAWYTCTDLGDSYRVYSHKSDCPYNYICTSAGLLEVESACYVTDRTDILYRSVYYRDASDAMIGCVEWNHRSTLDRFINTICCYGYKDPEAKGLGPWKRYSNGRYDELAAYDSCSVWDETADNNPTVYDYESNTIKPATSLALEDLEVDTLTVNCNAYVKGDLYVSGVTHTVEEETVSTSSDILVLRQNNDTPIAIGDASGLIINKYNGTDNLAVVVDQSGTLRVGDVSGTSSLPADIYLKAGKWYSDEECETEVHPSGELTSYDKKEIIGDVTKYTNAVFTSFVYSNLSPLLGRDELADMTDKGLLYFDKASWEAHTLTVPAKNGVALKYKKENNVDIYYWEKAAGVYVFANQAAYQAAASDIEDGSIIQIINEKSYVEAEIIA